MAIGEQSDWFAPALPVLKTTQVISVAMVSGTFVFLGIVFIMGRAGEPDEMLISSIAAASVVFALIGQWIIPWAATQASVRNLASQLERAPSRGVTVPPAWVEALTRLFVTRTILKMAILEGSAMFSLAAYLIEGHLWILGAYAIAVGAMLLQFPTQTSLANWLEAQAMQVQNEQQFSK